MMDQLQVIEDGLSNIDVSRIIEYSKKIDHLSNMNKMMAGSYMSDFIKAADITSGLLSMAIKFNLDAKGALETAEAIAYFDRAGEYLVLKGIKESADARKRYIDLDVDVQRAKDIFARTEAMVALLKNKYRSFLNAHDDSKKIGYGNNDLTNYEGM